MFFSLVLFLTLAIVSINVCKGKTSLLPDFQLGRELASHEQTEDKNNIVMTVNDYEISRKDFERTKTLMSFAKDKPATDSQVRDRIIESYVLYNEAVHRGLDTSYDEAKQFAETTKNSIFGDDSQIDREEIENQKAYIEGQGLSIDEFFETCIPKYQILLSIGKLRHEIYDEADTHFQDTRSFNQRDLVKFEKEYFNELCENLKNEAIVEDINQIN